MLLVDMGMVVSGYVCLQQGMRHPTYIPALRWAELLSKTPWQMDESRMLSTG